MPENGNKPGGYLFLWPYLAVTLVAVAATSGFLAWTRHPSARSIEIVSPAPSTGRTVYVGGAVASPGYFQVQEGSSIDDVLHAAGGVTEDASPDLKLQALPVGDEPTEQKVDINRAPSWLLQALPASARPGPRP